jgi:sulfatase maturation enzyme AslB (radical SAM superfamily)
MWRKLLVIVVVGIMLQNYAQASVEDDLSAIDNYKHSATQFLSILNSIKKHCPQYTTKDIGNWIAHAYKEVRKEVTDISIYDVAIEIKSMVISSSGSMKFNEMVATYIFTRPYD